MDEHFQIWSLEVFNVRSIRTLSRLPTAGIDCNVGLTIAATRPSSNATDLCLGARCTIQFTDRQDIAPTRIAAADNWGDDERDNQKEN